MPTKSYCMTITEFWDSYIKKSFAERQCLIRKYFDIRNPSKSFFLFDGFSFPLDKPGFVNGCSSLSSKVHQYFFDYQGTKKLSFYDIFESLRRIRLHSLRIEACSTLRFYKAKHRSPLFRHHHKCLSESVKTVPEE